MRVLVVEDERDLNNIITKYLKKNNFNVFLMEKKPWII